MVIALSSKDPCFRLSYSSSKEASDSGQIVLVQDSNEEDGQDCL